MTCDNKDGDYSCLTGSGVCVMNNQPTLLLYDEYEQGNVHMYYSVENPANSNSHSSNLTIPRKLSLIS